MPSYGMAQQTSPAPEYVLKVAVIFRLLKWVEWPEGKTDDPFVIRVIGKEPDLEDFEQILDKKINGRRIEIRHHRKYKEGMVVNDCHVLFISRSERRHVKGLLEATRGQGILTVGEFAGFVEEEGGMVNLTRVNKTIRFEINQKESHEGGLRIPSAILKLAVNVIRKN